MLLLLLLLLMLMLLMMLGCECRFADTEANTKCQKLQRAAQ
jgi:hypothetical protein